jgi:hypothetical protein
LSVGKAAIYEWQAHSLRLTVFPMEPPPTPNEWWAAVVGQEPENRVSRPKTRTSRDDGKFESGRLFASVQPQQIDWIYAANMQTEPETLFVGPFPKALDSFSPLAKRWLASMSPALKRMAFGAVLSLPVENATEGYRRLSPYLPNVKLDPEKSSDFLYQINRKRESRILGLEINRLSKWHVGQFVLMQQTASSGGGSGMFSIPETVSCLVELDINTIPRDQIPLSQEALVRLFDELVGLGQEIVKEGDIP